MSSDLCDLLVRDKLISETAAQAAKTQARRTGEPAIRALLGRGAIQEQKLAEYLSRKFSLPFLDLANTPASGKAIRLMPPDLIQRLQLLPIQIRENTLVVVVSDPTALTHLNHVKELTRMEVEACLVLDSLLARAIKKFVAEGRALKGGAPGGSASASSSAPGSSAVTGGISAATATATAPGSSAARGAPPARGAGGERSQKTFAPPSPTLSLSATLGAPAIVQHALEHALQRGASDVHFEIGADRVAIRMRVDGVLQLAQELPGALGDSIGNRIRVMAKLDISERRLPQDGRVQVELGGETVDLRVNTLPTVGGESVVLRVFRHNRLLENLGSLGFRKEQEEAFRRAVSAADGLVLVTGPTGSGKTTTLYSALSTMDAHRTKITTVEDPVEHQIPGVTQVQVNKEVELDFATALKALLRQDPDVILVGEIRDPETAAVACQAAITGHLVLSTLHTHDAPGAAVRLIDMGVPPFLVVSALTTVVAQRLVRKLCPDCRVEQAIAPAQWAPLGFGERELAGRRLYQAKGCARCGGTGYRGRMAVYEIFELTEAMKAIVLSGRDLHTLKKAAEEKGMMSLRRSALLAALEGQTSLEEALAASDDD